VAPDRAVRHLARLIIPYLSLTLPISIWTLSAFFRRSRGRWSRRRRSTAPTTWQAFRKVIVPLAAPGVFTTAIIAFFIAWNDFVYGISLTVDERRPARSRGARSVLRCLAVRVPHRRHLRGRRVVTIPVIILVLLFQRRIVAGLTNGAVKG
jgi:multiple sugar transport system permease protein